MNKYQEAMNYLWKSYDENKIYGIASRGYLDTLQELVERETPKKPLDVCTPVVKWGLCPVCKGELNKLGGKSNRVFSNQKYCPDCG